MFTPQNSDYSQWKCDELNAEFEDKARQAGITREDALGDEWRNAEKAFADDVAGR